ncbi:hypothetical protein [Clostridium sp.]|uniref:hypothetical protein n=1 Tax=Clostridium sp. TaxID=1506 RepID=UPI002608E76E|nr:hypothetical protein [Clostridium sp.]
MIDINKLSLLIINENDNTTEIKEVEILREFETEYKIMNEFEFYNYSYIKKENLNKLKRNRKYKIYFIFSNNEEDLIQISKEIIIQKLEYHKDRIDKFSEILNTILKL